MRNGTPASTPQQRGKRRARKAGLTYVNDFSRGLTRRRCGTGFTYLSSQGQVIRSARTRQRIESLVIPPAWEEVWICPRAEGHIQAVGRDEAGRRQYIYHEQWQVVSSATKYDRMHCFASLLPRIRRRVRRDLRGRRLTRNRVLAAVVRLIDKAQIRIGNERYAEENGSRGATTLSAEHVEVGRHEVCLSFTGKGGQEQEISFSDPKLARVIRQCEELNGQYLFCYCSGPGEECRVTSTDINNYLREISGEAITAKDFRTWWGSVVALEALADLEPELSQRQRKRRSVAAVEAAAECLGNTTAVCRSSYVHPGILSAAESGELPALIGMAGRKKHPHPEMSTSEALMADLLPHLEFS
jgi:DNA topoisomerase I